MTLMDLIEMVADWVAAGNLQKHEVNIEYLQNRFKINPQLMAVLVNTIELLNGYL